MFRIPAQIAYLTYRDCIRQPIYLILLLASYSTIGLQPVFAQFAFREQQKLVTDGVLATILTFGILVAVICADRAISRDIRSGTAVLVLCKPVSHATFILGKILGILAVVAVFTWVNGLGAVTSVHIARDDFDLDRPLLAALFGAALLSCIAGAAANRIGRWSFPATTCGGMAGMASLVGLAVIWNVGVGDPEVRNLLTAIVLVGLGLSLMALVAAVAAVQFELVTNLIVSCVIFLFGLISDYAYLQVRGITAEELLGIVSDQRMVLIAIVALAWFGATFGIRRFSRIPDSGRRPPGLDDDSNLDLSPQKPESRRSRWQFLVHLLFASACIGIIVAPAPTATWPTHEGYGSVSQRLVTAMIPIKDFVIECVHTVIPNWQLFWMADALASGTTIPASYVAHALVYFALFFVASITGALLLFRKRDLHIAR